VTDTVTGYESGNTTAAGYTITGYGATSRTGGAGSRTYTYTCP